MGSDTYRIRFALVYSSCYMCIATDSIRSMLHIAMITIVFVCEHGAAKSVVAAAEFNCLAEERHLPYRAIARGTEPQAEIATSAANGLRADGLAVPAGPPQKRPADDVAHAA